MVDRGAHARGFALKLFTIVAAGLVGAVSLADRAAVAGEAILGALSGPLEATIAAGKAAGYWWRITGAPMKYAPPTSPRSTPAAAAYLP